MTRLEEYKALAEALEQILDVMDSLWLQLTAEEIAELAHQSTVAKDRMDV